MKCRHGRLGKCPLCAAEAQQHQDIIELKERVEHLEREVKRLARHAPPKEHGDDY